MKKIWHEFIYDLKQHFIDLNIKYISSIPDHYKIEVENAIWNKQPVITYGYLGEQDNGINGQFEVYKMDINETYNLDDFFLEIVGAKFKELYPYAKIQDAYGTYFDRENGIKLFNVYGDEDIMIDRVGFYQLSLTPITIIYVGKKNKVFLESADLVYDYYDKRYLWENHIKLELDPSIRTLIEEMGIGKRAYYRKEKHFSFLVRNPDKFIKKGFEYNHKSGKLIIPIS